MTEESKEEEMEGEKKRKKRPYLIYKIHSARPSNTYRTTIVHSSDFCLCLFLLSLLSLLLLLLLLALRSLLFRLSGLPLLLLVTRILHLGV